MAAPPQKMKKLPFKPTALGRAASSTSKEPGAKDDDGLELFRRSKEMAPALLADQERRRRRHQQKIEADRARASLEKRPLGDEEEEDEEGGGSRGAMGGSASASPLQKRRGSEHGGDTTTLADEEDRVSNHGPDSRSNSLATPPSSKRVRLDSGKQASPRTPRSSRSLAVESPSTGRSGGRRSRRLAKVAASASPEVEVTPTAAPIILLDSDEEDPAVSRSSQPAGDKHAQTIESDDDVEEEDEFAEYVLRAKEQRARDLSRSQEDAGFDSDYKTVEVHISSRIAGTKSCLVKVLYDRSLNMLRHSWFTTQRIHNVVLPPGFIEADAVLTWCGAPVYNYTSLRDLGIRPCGSGRVTASRSNLRGIRADGARVLMEIWTPEGFKQLEEQERQKRESRDMSDGEDEVVQQPEPEKMKISLAARDLESVELRVQPETTVDTIVTKYRAFQQLPASHQITLWFDGEMLEGHTTMNEADIDDMDTIEVHIKP